MPCVARVQGRGHYHSSPPSLPEDLDSGTRAAMGTMTAPARSAVAAIFPSSRQSRAKEAPALALANSSVPQDEDSKVPEERRRDSTHQVAVKDITGGTGRIGRECSGRAGSQLQSVWLVQHWCTSGN